jgi:hypothetical protein
MDRQIVYPGQILPETSLLQMAKDAMIGSAKLAAAVLGTSTIANGFAVTPTGPASLQVVVAPGEVYALANIDSLAFSSLPADTTHSIMKQGILLDGVTLSCPAPTTTGQSINYLIQVTYQDQDSTPVLLPYYNSANPAMPYSGMGNNGQTQNTARKGVAVAQVKAGASAATGSQITPAPDAGYVGLYVATVAYGQTTITSASITQYPGAPLLTSGLVQSLQTGNSTFAIDTGSANTYVCNYTPAITTLTSDMVLRFRASSGNTGASTFNPNGLGAKPIVGAASSALQGGEINGNSEVWLQYNPAIGSGSWVILASAGGATQVVNGSQSLHAVNISQLLAAGSPYAIDTGTVNAYAATFSPPITALTDGIFVRVKAINQNTGASTFSPNGLAVKPIVGAASLALQGGEINSNGEVWLQYNPAIGSGSWVIVASAGGSLQLVPGSASAHAASIGQIQAQSNTAFVTAGTAPAFTLSPSPAVTSLTAGLRFRASFNAAGTLGSNTLNVNGLGAKSLVQFDANGALVLANITSGLLTDVEYNGVSWVVLDPVVSKMSVVGMARNLRMSVTAASSTASMTADEIVVETALGGMACQLSSVSKTINLATTGAGGMDTGSPPASGFVAVYAIYSQTTNASALLAVNATSVTAPNVYGGANMPATYTASALLTVVATNGSGQFQPVLVQDRKVSFQYVSTLATSGGVTLTSYSLSAAIPLNAKSCAGHVSISVTGAGTTTASLASSATTTTNGMGCKFFAATGSGGTSSQQTPFPPMDLVTAQAIYYSLATTGTGAGLSLFISEYII